MRIPKINIKTSTKENVMNHFDRDINIYPMKDSSGESSDLMFVTINTQLKDNKESSEWFIFNFGKGTVEAFIDVDDLPM